MDAKTRAKVEFESQVLDSIRWHSQDMPMAIGRYIYELLDPTNSDVVYVGSSKDDDALSTIKSIKQPDIRAWMADLGDQLPIVRFVGKKTLDVAEARDIVAASAKAAGASLRFMPYVRMLSLLDVVARRMKR